MSTELLVGRVSNGVVIRIVGHGTMQESLAFRAVAESNIDDGVVVFDATQCEYLDSTFLGSLIGIKKACEQSPTRRFVIAACDAARVKLFSTSSLDQYFDFVDTCPCPVDEFEPVDVDKLDPLTLGRHVQRCHERLADRGGHDATIFRSIADRLTKELDDKQTE